MAITLTAFSQIPLWMEQMESVQQKLNEISSLPAMLELQHTISKLNEIVKPLIYTQPSWSERAQRMANILNTPAIQGLQRQVDLYTPHLNFAQKELSLLAEYGSLGDLQSRISMQVLAWSQTVDIASLRYGHLMSEEAQRLSQIFDFMDTTSSELELESDISDKSEKFSLEEQEIVAAEVESILTSEKNWDQRFMESIRKLKIDHPTIAAFLMWMFLPILTTVIGNLISTAIGQTLVPARVYEEPKASSQVVYNLELNQSYRR